LIRPRKTAAPTKEISRLFLGVNPDMIPIEVVGELLFGRGLQWKSIRLSELFLEGLCGPAVLEEKEFQTGAFAVFTEYFAIPEYFRRPR